MAKEKLEIKAAYLAKSKDLEPFLYQFWPSNNLESLFQKRVQFESPRQILHDVLIQQNSSLPNSAKVQANIELLKAKNTLSVCTGHQVCLFGGPMFTLYKIASTIALAKRFSEQYPAYNFVPVLWMATEDHDWEEVNHYYSSFDQKNVYQANVNGPVGRHIITENILQVLPKDCPDWLKECYSPGKTFANAFRELMHHLFGQFGLVILDADNKALKQHFSSAMQRELLGNGIQKPVEESTKLLQKLGYHTQVHPREINLFYLGNEGRHLIRFDGNRYFFKENKLEYSPSEILNLHAQNPEDFSPNVAFRPMYQESLLPNVAYIGGWAEVTYWHQFKAGFDTLELPFPLLVPRLHATILKDSDFEAWQEFGYEFSDFSKPLHQVFDEYIARNWDLSESKTMIEAVLSSYSSLGETLGEIDPTLREAMQAERTRRQKTMDRLEKKIRKSIRNKNPKVFKQIASIKNIVAPDNASQQRILNFLALGVDSDHLIAQIMEVANPENTDAKWIRLA